MDSTVRRRINCSDVGMVALACASLTAQKKEDDKGSLPPPSWPPHPALLLLASQRWTCPKSSAPGTRTIRAGLHTGTSRNRGSLGQQNIPEWNIYLGALHQAERAGDFRLVVLAPCEPSPSSFHHPSHTPQPFPLLPVFHLRNKASPSSVSLNTGIDTQASERVEDDKKQSTGDMERKKVRVSTSKESIESIARTPSVLPHPPPHLHQ
ncbi:hypothetical protein O3P69_002193 [Scylla paramamosain]|uniref:Uncharacterized protein n=1 Tax=Scylla paramamosain TaxID=85552 RepID=A0AAW0V571_SCYPA